MHPYFYPYVITPVFIRRNLKGLSFETDTVVGTYCPFMLFAQDVVQICPNPLNKRCPLFSCRAHKLLIVGRYHIYSQMPHCPAKLCRIVLVYLSSCLRSMPVVASSIGIEGTE